MSKKLLVVLTLILVAGFVSNASAGLVAEWKFSEGAGNVVADSVAGNNGGLLNWNGAATGSWVTVDGRTGYNFNKTDSMNTPVAALSAVTNQIDMKFWMLMNTNNPDEMPFNQVFGTGGGGTVYMGISYNPYVGANTATVCLGQGWADQTWMDLSDVYNDGKWHEYEFVKDATLGANSYIKLYLDGALMAQVMGTTSPINAGGMYKFDIGSSIWGGTSSNVALSDVRISNTIIPEPATMALLGLGGLALLRRRTA